MRVVGGVALILSLPAGAMLFTKEKNWSPFDFALASVLLTVIGVTLELAVRRKGALAAAIALAAIGITAAVFGEADDAPGLVLVGIVIIVSACALGVRARAQHG